MQVEILTSDILAEGEKVVPLVKVDRPGGHVRPHPPLQPQPPVRTKKSRHGEFNIQQMDVQTYFFRRTNMNAPGQPRS